MSSTLFTDTLHRAAEALYVMHRRHDQRLAEAYLTRRGWTLDDSTQAMDHEAAWRDPQHSLPVHWRVALSEQLRRDDAAVADTIAPSLLNAEVSNG